MTNKELKERAIKANEKYMGLVDEFIVSVGKKDIAFDDVQNELCKMLLCLFADWQKKQMMKDAVDAHILDSANPVTEDIVSRYISCYYENKDNTPFIQAGDKVKLIIIKEAEK